MIPNILYNILRNNSSNNSNNTDNNSNNNPDNPDNPNNDSNNPNNNPDNNDQNNNYSINNPNSNPNTITNNNLEDNTRSRNIHLYDSNQLITSPPTVTSNQSIFNNIRFGSPVCILRAPSDLDIPSTSSAHTDENSSEQPPLSAILLPPNIPRNTSSSFNEPVEIAKTNDKPTGGIFSDKYPLHVLPVEGNNNHLFVNRISYNTPTNAYYENGILSNKYLKKWNEGAYQLDNIEIKVEYDWMKTYLARLPTNERMNDDGEISWKFDYRIGSFVINSLKIRLSFGTFDNSASVKWFIKSLPTMKNQNPDWQSIQFDPYAEYRHEVNVVKDVTQFVKNEYGFILKAHLSGGESTEIIWQKTQLFRQDWSRVLVRGIDVEDDNTFGFDVNVELKPDIIVNPLPELSESFVLNDESTSDFVIHYKFTTGDNQGTSSSSSSDKESKESRVFHVHSAVLSKRSDYFNALLESRMIESQNKSLTLTDADISYDSLEVILNYLYTGTIPNIKSYDEWITLLHYAARFLIPTLIQNCEKVLKGYYLNHDNLDEIKAIASESGAEQLLQCCEYFELPEIN